MVAHVDKVGADMAQLNVTVEEHILTAVDRLASDRQMSRPALVRALLDEALAADLVGRPLFAQTAMARRRGGGGRQERTDSPRAAAGCTEGRNAVEHPDPRSGPGCTPSRRGYRAVTPPVTLEPRQTPPRTRCAATIGGQPQAERKDRPVGPGEVSAIAPALLMRWQSRLATRCAGWRESTASE